MPPASQPAALPPDLLEQVRSLFAHARALVAGERAGLHRSRQLGGGSEYADTKSYSPGDDLRHLDWKVLARTDRYVVRRYETDRVTDVRVLLDCSGSMAFGSTSARDPAAWGPWPKSKWEAARSLALGLCFLFLRQGDRVGLTIVSGAGRTSTRIRGGEHLLPHLAGEILAAEPTGVADLGDLAEQGVAPRRRAIVVLISDLLGEDEEAWARALGLHTARGREAWLLQVVDPAEIDFPYEEPTRFNDLEGDRWVLSNPRELARAYRREFAAFLERQRQRCLVGGIHHLLINTGDPLDRSLGAFLRSRP